MNRRSLFSLLAAVPFVGFHSQPKMKTVFVVGRNASPPSTKPIIVTKGIRMSEGSRKYREMNPSAAEFIGRNGSYVAESLCDAIRFLAANEYTLIQASFTVPEGTAVAVNTHTYDELATDEEILAAVEEGQQLA